MWLEHVYGYAGSRNLSNNAFYTLNTNTAISEVEYYTGMVGIIFRKDLHDAGKYCFLEFLFCNFAVLGLPSQRFFFGHDNDIECLAIHPSRQRLKIIHLRVLINSVFQYHCSLSSLYQMLVLDAYKV